MSKNYSTAQLMTCVIARDLSDSDRVAFGLHAGIGLGAALLAQKLHAPHLQIRHGLHESLKPALSPSAWTAEKRTESRVSYFESHDEMLLWGNPTGSQTFSSVFFISGLQIDRYGATNLVGIRNQASKPHIWLVRGPGSIGTPSAAWFCAKYYLFSFCHDLRTFVPKVDVVSVPGTDRLRALGYPKKFPRLCITPLGVFGWDNAEGTMKIISLHPGVTIDEVQERTGFELVRPDRVRTTEIPSSAEQKALKEIDPKGEIFKLDSTMLRD
ncbi:hypothetical protein AUK40_05430 [Candidatus Wirthbacteria bacterium CG2_30_54_11]|uniref:CoA-transferase n=1 Tax=Candidatus Wirthbacteria bacterium CG2_30_54_11 TaxID=1817892 RepID=A0A1J5IFX6_9BACT|nr:MAG: hypothetical protein AUK40_05430 [Candidatus Wirthbacteria bacterium CG2_30_54_11]